MSLVYLDEVCDSISNTLDKSTKNIVLINTSDVFDGKVLNHEFVPNENIKGQFKKLFRENDILYSEIRPANKHFAFVDFNSENYVASTKLMVLRAKEDLIHPKFLFYILKSNVILNHLQGLAESRSGTFPQITFSELSTISINLPSLSKQRKILCFLDNIEHKIENLNKINHNLEEQILKIFYDWFVKFNICHEFEESELGLIPNGWSIDYFGSKKSNKIIGSGINEFKGSKIYIATADVDNSSIINNTTFITMEDKPSRANMQPVEKSIWFAKMIDSRKLIMVDDYCYDLLDNYIFSTGFCGLKCKKEYFYYLWTFLLTNGFDTIKNNFCTGTTMQAINNKDTKMIKFVLPDLETISKFNKIAKPIFEKIYYNNQEIYHLVNLRDTLLPKLMSGEIDVSEVNCDLD